MKGRPHLIYRDMKTKKVNRPKKRETPKILVIKTEKEAPKPKEVHYLDEPDELDEFDVRSVWPL